MSDATKKSRSPQICQSAFIRGMMCLRHELGQAPTINELTTFFNTHTYGQTGWSANKEGVPNGIRNHLSVSSRLSQVRGEIEDALPQIGQEKVNTLLAILEVTGAAREVTNFDSIVSDIASLGLLRAPSNMIQNSGHIGTNGQPVSAEWIEV